MDREQELLIDGDRMVRNVSVPTLEVFAPTGEPNGTAVIVAPGGAYQLLMVDYEGTDLARWLAARGVAAFVLRYRIAHTPEDDGEMVRFRRELDEHVRTTPWSAGRIAIIGKEAERAKALGDEDGRQAIRLLRARADEWGVDPARGRYRWLLGGRVGSYGGRRFPRCRQPANFAAPIYGARPDELVVPDDAPPLFLALAIDDAMVPATESVSIWKAWRRSRPPGGAPRVPDRRARLRDEAARLGLRYVDHVARDMDARPRAARPCGAARRPRGRSLRSTFGLAVLRVPPQWGRSRGHAEQFGDSHRIARWRQVTSTTADHGARVATACACPRALSLDPRKRLTERTVSVPACLRRVQFVAVCCSAESGQLQADSVRCNLLRSMRVDF